MSGGAIWLASYPRSGNTWARLALYALQHGGKLPDLNAVAGFGRMVVGRQRLDEWLLLDSADLTADEIDELRPQWHEACFAEATNTLTCTAALPELCKVHDAWSMTPSGRAIFAPAFTAASIYLVRDPRDVAISWAHFNGWSLDRAIDFLGDSDSQLCAPGGRLHGQIRQRLGSWSQHLESWLVQSQLQPLCVRYESMLAAPHTTLAQMAAHLGWTVTAAQIEAAVQATGFKALAEQEQRLGFGERPHQTERFFREGRAGGWREVLSEDQIARIEHDHAVWMQRLGYLHAQAIGPV